MRDEGSRGLCRVPIRRKRERPFLDPATNIRIGTTVLAEAIRLRGSLTGGLQFYAGSSDPAGGYANRVLAEKARLEQATQHRATPSA